MIPKVTSITDYFDKQENWSKELILLHDILCETELEPCVKWNSPVYTLNGKKIIGLLGFKNYFGLWFHQGCFLKDQQNLLINGQEGVTKALRQMRFSSMDDVDIDVVKAYIQESIDNHKAGKELKSTRKVEFEICDELESEFASNGEFKKAFESLTPGRQKEYATYVLSAKQEKTRLSRVQKIIPLILDGKGLNDKYK